MMKYLFIPFVCVLMISTANSQDIKEFFIPRAPKNKASFYTPNKVGERTEMTSTIYYINKGNSYELITSQMFKNNLGAISMERFEFSSNEAKMTLSESTNAFETNKKRIYSPALIILKVPSKGQKVTWSYMRVSGELINCTSYWETEMIDGIDLDAIKVEKQHEGIEDATIIITYVRGIGLWKTEIKDSDGKIQIIEILDKIGYDPDVKL